VLAACFVTDLGTVVALGLIFRAVHVEDVGLRRRRRTRGLIVVAVADAALLQALRQRPSELEAKFLLFFLSAWARSPLGRQRGGAARVLIGMVLAGTVGKDQRAGAPGCKRASCCPTATPRAVVVDPDRTLRLCGPRRRPLRRSVRVYSPGMRIGWTRALLLYAGRPTSTLVSGPATARAFFGGACGRPPTACGKSHGTMTDARVTGLGL
jgi:hypothetical protein